MRHQSTRRRTVKNIGTLLLGVSLAGCSGSGSGDGNGGGGGDGNGGGGGDGNGGGGGDGSGGGDENNGSTTTVDMTDELAYDPEQVTIGVGETVVWENVGSVGHSVTAYEDEIPDGADYFASGDFDSEQAARDAYVPGDADAGDVQGGESYEHTFETPGTYEYFCIPHESAGMVGTVEVEES